MKAGADITIAELVRLLRPALEAKYGVEVTSITVRSFDSPIIYIDELNFFETLKLIRHKGA